MGIGRLERFVADWHNAHSDVAPSVAPSNDLQVNLLTVKTGIPISRLSALLFTLEMKGVVRSLAGGMYHLLK